MWFLLCLPVAVSINKAAVSYWRDNEAYTTTTKTTTTAYQRLPNCLEWDNETNPDSPLCLSNVDLNYVPELGNNTVFPVWTYMEDDAQGDYVRRHRAMPDWDQMRAFIGAMEPESESRDFVSANFLEVGAGFGELALPMTHWMKTMNRSGTYVVMEAYSKAATLLNKTAQYNDLPMKVFRATPYMRLGKGHTRPAQLCLGGDALEEGGGLDQSKVIYGDASKIECIEDVPTITVDDWLDSVPEMKHVLMMRLNCKGCEGNFLLGAKSWLEQHGPCWLQINVDEKQLCNNLTPWHMMKHMLDVLHYVGVEKAYENVFQYLKTKIGKGGCDSIHERPPIPLLLRKTNLEKCTEKFTKYIMTDEEADTTVAHNNKELKKIKEDLEAGKGTTYFSAKNKLLLG